MRQRILRWYETLPPPWRSLIITILVLFISLSVISAVKIDFYVERDPNFCVSCHEMPESYFRDLTASAHRTIACSQCHAMDRATNFALLMDYVLLPKDRLKGHFKLNPRSCGDCHRELTPRIFSDSAGDHYAHIGRPNLECMKCHAFIGHRQAASDESCKSCHPSHVVYSKGMGDFSCTVCHSFSSRADLRPARDDCLKCHQYLESARKLAFNANENVMHMSCGNCHKPHRPDFQTFTPMVCQRCHGVQVKMEGPQGKAHLQCTTCHAPHSWIAPNDTCLKCHKPSPAVEEHGIPKHASDCTFCHRPHDFAHAKLPACNDCHKNIKTSPLTQRGAHKTCTVCHQPTTWAFIGEDACLKCHSVRISDQHARLNETACLTCHKPHEWKPATGLCESCHRDAATVGLHSSPTHQKCLNCHVAHAFEKVQSSQCTLCHSSVKHPPTVTIQPGVECASCHPFSRTVHAR